MREPIFDIFTGTTMKNAIWLESVEGLSNARARMNEIAAQIPGRYFIWSCLSQTILIKVETVTKPEVSKAKIA